MTLPGGNYYNPNEAGGIEQGLISIPLTISPDTFTEPDETIIYQLGTVITGGGNTAARDLTFADANCNGVTLNTATGTITNDDEADHGDTPASYGDPAHDILAPTTVYLGLNAPDGEAALQADDGADEDGVTLPTLAQNTFANISVTVAGAGGFLQAWIDFDGNGSFDPGEQIANDLQDGGSLDTDATAGVIAFNVLVPATAVTTPTYARFRWATTAGLDATGAATDGEVEDYPVTIQTGPAPFTCDSSLYQLAGRPATLLRRVTFSASGASFNDLGSFSSGANAGWGYNELDNLLYGVKTGTQDLFRVDANGVFTNLGAVTGMGSDTGSVAGDVDPNGILITRSNPSNRYYRIDLTTQPYAVVGFFDLQGDAQGIRFVDVAYNPDDDMLYGVNGSKVYRIDPINGNSVEVMSTSLGFTGANGTWFDENGILYGYTNGNNTYYAVNIATQQTAAIGVSDIDENGRNDGTSCRGPSPVPFGNVTGTVYEDTDQDDAYNVGVETPLPNISVSVYEENGTPGNTGDDTLVSTVSTDTNGFYTISFILAFPSNTYRIEVDTADPELPSGAMIGTTNPLTNITVTNGGTTANQDFGFDTGVSVSGTVYEDTQPNGALDSGETGTGETLFVKRLSRIGSTCNAPALQAVAANPASGAYTFSNVTTGDYCLIIDTNDTLADTTPNPASGWTVSTPTNGLRHISVANQNVPNQHFGLYHGSQLSGTVFQDNADPSGTANDGIQNGAESGIANVSLALTDCVATTHDTATTNASGNYTLRIPSTVTNGATLCVIETNPGSHLSTGASVGNTGGSYTRTSDTVQFTYNSGTSYSGVDFGDVPPNQWLTDGQQSGLPGTVLWYPHTFTAGSAGTVTFSTTASPSPAVSGWSETLYEDSNCNGVIDTGESQISSMATSTGQQICVLMREAIPNAASTGAAQHVTVTATFDYSNASPALSDVQTRTDVTTVGEGTTAGLHLLKAVDKAQALPGEILTYTVTYSNRSTEPLSNLVIHDKTPAFTVFQSAACDTPLPADFSSCNVTQQPTVGGTGAIEWTFGGTLRPGHQGTVTFSIQIQN